jgi:hypothetical protein
MEDVCARAAEHGFALEVTELSGQPVWGWHRGDGWRHQCFLSEREAFNYMADWLRRRDAFEPKQGWL